MIQDIADDEKIPIAETYRGIGIHVFQTKDRVRAVKAAIDAVYGLEGIGALFTYAANARNPPEARLLAAAKCEAAWELATENREARPDIDLARLRAAVSGADSLRIISLWEYGSLFDVKGVKREKPLTDADIDRARKAVA